MEQSRNVLYCGSVAGDEAVPVKGQRAVWEDSLVEKQLEGRGHAHEGIARVRV